MNVILTYTWHTDALCWHQCNTILQFIGRPQN